MDNLVLTIILLSGLIIMFAIGEILGHLFRLDKYLKYGSRRPSRK